MGWVYLSHPDSTAGAVRFPDDQAVLDAQYARGWEQVDLDPDPPPAALAVEPDEVDGKGQGWVVMRHAETGGEHAFPAEVVDDQRSRGWEAVSVLEAAEAKKSKSSKKKTESTAVDGETEKES